MIKLRWTKDHPIADEYTRERMNKMRQCGVLTDMGISCGTTFRHCHKIILLNASNYIRKISEFQAHNLGKLFVISVKEEHQGHVEHLLQFLYAGTLLIDANNFHGLCKLASTLCIKFLVDGVQQECSKGLKRNNVQTLQNEGTKKAKIGPPESKNQQLANKFSISQRIISDIAIPNKTIVQPAALKTCSSAANVKVSSRVLAEPQETDKHNVAELKCKVKTKDDIQNIHNNNAAARQEIQITKTTYSKRNPEIPNMVVPNQPWKDKLNDKNFPSAANKKQKLRCQKNGRKSPVNTSTAPQLNNRKPNDDSISIVPPTTSTIKPQSKFTKTSTKNDVKLQSSKEIKVKVVRKRANDKSVKIPMQSNSKETLSTMPQLLKAKQLMKKAMSYLWTDNENISRSSSGSTKVVARRGKKFKILPKVAARTAVSIKAKQMVPPEFKETEDLKRNGENKSVKSTSNQKLKLGRPGNKNILTDIVAVSVVPGNGTDDKDKMNDGVEVVGEPAPIINRPRRNAFTLAQTKLKKITTEILNQNSTYINFRKQI